MRVRGLRAPVVGNAPRAHTLADVPVLWRRGPMSDTPTRRRRRPTVSRADLERANALNRVTNVSIARALQEARRDGYLSALVQVEQALYGGMPDVAAVLRTAREDVP